MARRFQDLTGSRFGRLVVTAPAGRGKRRDRLWSCICDCGNQTVKSRQSLGKAKFCSMRCLYRGGGDLIGRRFGRLVVIEWAGRSERGDRLWHCICDCGTKVIKSGGVLLSGAVLSCGCRYRDRGRNLVGERFGRLVVIDRAGRDREVGRLWLCQCDCGKKAVKPGRFLMTGSLRCCGCISRKPKDLTGKRFKWLVVIEQAGVDRWGRRLWHCICYCGTETIEIGKMLLAGRTTSCGCVSGRKRNNRIPKCGARRPQDVGRLLRFAAKTFTEAEWEQVERIAGERDELTQKMHLARVEAVELVLRDRRTGEMACHGGPLRSL